MFMIFWFMAGVFTFLLALIIEEDDIILRDLVIGLTISLMAGLFGLSIAIVYIILQEVEWNKVIIRKNKNEK